MLRKLLFLLAALTLAVLVAVPALAAPGQPNFMPSVYGDGAVWGTKGTTTLPAPTDNNAQSFDKLFVITNGAHGQLPVSEAAPGNPNYNGGRWFTHTVTWTDLAEVTLLTSYADVMMHYEAGHLTVEAGSPEGGPPAYFQCPLLPVK